MKRLVQFMAVVALGAAAFAAVSIGLAAGELRTLIGSDDVNAIVQTVATVTRHADKTLDAADTLTARAIETTKQSVETQKALQRAAENTGTLISATSESLNGEKGLIPAASLATLVIAKDAHETFTLAQEQTVAVAAAGTAALDEHTRLAHNLAELSGNPHLSAVMAHADETLAGTAVVTTSAGKIAAKFAGDYVRPATRWEKFKASVWIPIKIALKVW